MQLMMPLRKIKITQIVNERFIIINILLWMNTGRQPQLSGRGRHLSTTVYSARVLTLTTVCSVACRVHPGRTPVVAVAGNEYSEAGHEGPRPQGVL